MSTFHPTSLFDRVFEGGILLKGLSGALEFFGGLLVLLVGPSSIHNFLSFITQREIIEDPNDIVANFLLQSTAHIGTGGKAFIVVYLWIHASIKLIAVIGIIKNQLWAYPFSLITLGLLMLYQVYVIVFVQASAGIILLTVFDVFILWLIGREYTKVKDAFVHRDLR